MYFRIEQWRAWAPGLLTHADWHTWQQAPCVITDSGQQPDVSFLPAMQRRRLSRLARMTMHTTWPLSEIPAQLPLVFVCRHGETPRTLELLSELAQQQPLSPTQFSLSVHNAIIGQWSILRGDRSEMTALAAAGDGLENGIMEAACLLAEGAPGVLLVVAEESPPALYQPYISDVPFPYALALLLRPGQDWQLQLQTGDGPPADWPHALSLIGALCRQQATLEHHWNGRKWIWSHSPS